MNSKRRRLLERREDEFEEEKTSREENVRRLDVDTLEPSATVCLGKEGRQRAFRYHKGNTQVLKN